MRRHARRRSRAWHRWSRNRAPPSRRRTRGCPGRPRACAALSNVVTTAAKGTRAWPGDALVVRRARTAPGEQRQQQQEHAAPEVGIERQAGVEREYGHRQRQLAGTRGARAAGDRANATRAPPAPRPSATAAGRSRRFRSRISSTIWCACSAPFALAQPEIVGRAIAVGVGVAEAAHADAVDRMSAIHARGGAPDARVRPDSAVVQAGAFAAEHGEAALDAALELRREAKASTDHRDRAERHSPAVGVQPSRRQPRPSSTSANTSQDAREPASRITMPSTTAATIQPSARSASRRRLQRERRQGRQHQAELEVAGAEDAAEAVRGLRRRRTWLYPLISCLTASSPRTSSWCQQTAPAPPHPASTRRR